MLVVGRPAVRRVMQLAADAGVADQVIACGPSSDIARFHAAADLFVLPTQYEAFSLGILEALGSGLPVVTSDVAGARDAIRVGVNGVLVRDPRDGEEFAAVLRPMLDPTARAALAAGVAESVRSYQWPAVLERYEQVLQACTR